MVWGVSRCWTVRGAAHELSGILRRQFSTLPQMEIDMKLKRLLAGKDMKHGFIPPLFYGVAFYLDDIAVLYPIPLNLLVRLWRNIWYWLTYAGRRSKWERELREHYMQGWHEGHAAGKSPAPIGEVQDSVERLRARRDRN